MSTRIRRITMVALFVLIASDIVCGIRPIFGRDVDLCSILIVASEALLPPRP